MKVAIVGAGLIGQKRAAALCAADQIVAVVEPDAKRAADFTARFGAVKVCDLKTALESDAEIVLIATPHNQLAPLAKQALLAGKHVLLEKPAAISSAQCDELAALALEKKLVVRVGYNHRFHPAILEAMRLFSAGAIGEMMFVRARYGHGGRLGYEREWRANSEISGGGELVDQGAHLLDLTRLFMGDISLNFADIPTLFWNMSVEDTAFLSLQNNNGARAWLQAGWTEWKNIFSLELMGRVGKIMIEGLGGSYGPETLTFYKMLPEMGPPLVTQTVYDEDNSWQAEWQEMQDSVRGESSAATGATLADAAAVWRIIERAYGEFRL